MPSPENFLLDLTAAARDFTVVLLDDGEIQPPEQVDPLPLFALRICNPRGRCKAILLNGSEQGAILTRRLLELSTIWNLESPDRF